MQDYRRNPAIEIQIKDTLHKLFESHNPTPEKTRKIQPKAPETILICDSFLAAKEIKRIRVSEGVSPYGICSLRLVDAFCGNRGEEVRAYMYRMVEIALRKKTIRKIEIILFQVELSCRINTWSEIHEIIARIKELIGERKIEIVPRIVTEPIDERQFTDILVNCIDYRWTKRNIKDFTLDVRNPVVFGFAGSGAVLLSRLGSDIQLYVIEQIIYVHSLLGIKRLRVVNHGDGCGGYGECGKGDSAAINDLKKLKPFLAKLFVGCGLYGIDFEVYFKTEYKGAIDMEKGWIEEKIEDKNEVTA